MKVSEFLIQRGTDEMNAIFNKAAEHADLWGGDPVRAAAEYDRADFEDDRRAKAAILAREQVIKTLADAEQAYDIAPHVAQQVLHLMALPYADHPDYEASWGTGAQAPQPAH